MHLRTAVCRRCRTVVFELEVRFGWKVMDGLEEGVLSSIFVRVEIASSCLVKVQVTDWRMLLGCFGVVWSGSLCVWVWVAMEVPFSRSVLIRWVRCSSWKKVVRRVILSILSKSCVVNSQE